MNRISPTVKQLLIINIIFYFGSSFSLNTEFIYSLFSLHFPENPEFKFWQLLTHMFMHGGILHLAFNMFALWMFGSAIESIFGSRRFLFFYLTCGLGAAIAQISFLYYSFYSNLDLLLNSGYDLNIPFYFLNRDHGWSTTKFKNLIANSVRDVEKN